MFKFKRERPIPPELPDIRVDKSIYDIAMERSVCQREIDALACSAFGLEISEAFDYDPPQGHELISATARTKTEHLVGYAALYYPQYRSVGAPYRGQLAFLMTDPEHIRHGIGSAMVIMRLEFADRRRMHLSIDELARTNTLCCKYTEDWGFRKLPDGHLYRNW